LTIAGVILPVFPVIARMMSVPLFLAVALVGLIVGIGCELFSLPFALAGPLAVVLAAIALIFDSGIRVKKALTMGRCTVNSWVHGFPPRGEKP
jgi:hypothetical protein